MKFGMDSGKLSGATMGALDMIETIKASGAEDGYFEKWSGYQASVNTQTVKFMRLDVVFGLITPILTETANILVLVIGIYLTIQGKFTVGMITAFQGYLGSFMSPVSMLIGAGQTILYGKAGLNMLK